MIEFVLPMKVTGEYGLNKLYAGVHWSKRKRQAEYMHGFVRGELHRQRIRRRIFYSPVRLTLYYNDRLDCTNHGYLTKLIEDALKGYFIQDDSRKYVKAVTQEFWDGDGIRVRIEEA